MLDEADRGRTKSKATPGHGAYRQTLEGLSGSTPGRLHRLFKKGSCPKVENLVGWEFRGWSISPWMALAGYRKFKQGFYLEDPAVGAGEKLDGYNVLVRQNGLYEPWLEREWNGSPLRLGWFVAAPAPQVETDPPYPQTLRLNYLLPTNWNLPLSFFLRDYLVQIAPDDPDLYLGKAALVLGPRWIDLTYFLLARHNPLSF